MIHALKMVIYEIFVKLRSNGAVLSFIVFSTVYSSQCIFDIKIDDNSSLALRFLETPQLKKTLRHSEEQKKFEMT